MAGHSGAERAAPGRGDAHWRRSGAAQAVRVASRRGRGDRTGRGAWLVRKRAGGQERPRAWAEASAPRDAADHSAPPVEPGGSTGVVSGRGTSVSRGRRRPRSSRRTSGGTQGPGGGPRSWGPLPFTLVLPAPPTPPSLLTSTTPLAASVPSPLQTPPLIPRPRSQTQDSLSATPPLNPDHFSPTSYNPRSRETPSSVTHPTSRLASLPTKNLPSRAPRAPRTKGPSGP